MLANKKSNRKPSKRKICPICNEEFAARGLVNHIRLLHKSKIIELTRESTFSLFDQRFPDNSGTLICCYENLLINRCNNHDSHIQNDKHEKNNDDTNGEFKQGFPDIHINKYTECMKFYRAHKDIALSEWTMYKDDYKMWSINQGKDDGFARLIEPTKRDIEFMKANYGRLYPLKLFV